MISHDTTLRRSDRQTIDTADGLVVLQVVEQPGYFLTEPGATEVPTVFRLSMGVVGYANVVWMQHLDVGHLTALIDGLTAQRNYILSQEPQSVPVPAFPFPAPPASIVEQE